MKAKIITAAAALCTAAAAASTSFASGGGCVMKVEKSDIEYDWSDGYNLVGTDSETGKTIPFCEYENGYFYAYVPADTEVTFKSGEQPHFNDLDAHAYAPGLSRMYARKIITGDENGNFNGGEILTRAQMAAIIARMINADETAAGEMPFKDVSENDWFAPAVYALYSRGIVMGDDYFNPSRSVTREELVTMEYRVVNYFGGTASRVFEYDGFVDIDTVSDYAREAYDKLYEMGYYLFPTFVPTGYGKSDQYLEPQKSITRTEACEYIDYFMSDFMYGNRPAIPTELAEEFGLDEEMPVITGSTSSYPITEQLYRSLFINHDKHVRFPAAHDKTIESYKLLIDGAADIILVPDPTDEVEELAESEGAELEYIPISNEALVFFTNGQNPAENITSEQIKSIYVDNAVSNWSEIGGPDAPFAAYCRNNDSGSHAQMERFFLDGREINEDIRLENISISMSSILTDVSGFAYDNPGSYALGYSMYYYFKNSVSFLLSENSLKLLSVDGVMPTDETLADRSYPLSTNYFAVIRADEPENSPARNVAGLLTSESGQSIIANAGFGSFKN